MPAETAEQPITSSPSCRAEVTDLRPTQMERAILLLMLPGISLSCVAWYFASIHMGVETWFERWQILPGAAGFFALFLLCLRVSGERVRHVRNMFLILLPGLALERFGLGLLWAGTYGPDPRWFDSLSPWLTLSACLFAFLVPGRGAVLVGFAYYLLVATLVALYLALNNHPLPQGTLRELLLSYLVAIPVFLVLTYGLSHLRLAYSMAMKHASSMEGLAMRDRLTGLFNRHVFDASMNRARARRARNGTPVSAIICDIDHFKSVNDTYGHNTGDHVIRTIAQVLQSEMRRTDEVIRWGGEEMLILLEETPLAGAVEVAHRLRARIESETLIAGRVVTASFGVAELADGEDDTAFIARADMGLYAAKEGGRNRVAEGVATPRVQSPSPKKSSALLIAV